VLCLGDGVGTLTNKMKEAGFQAMYHDLMDSRTAAFALARFAMRFKDDTLACLTAGFDPGGPHITPFDAIVSLDYLEHVPNVEDWVRAIFAALKPGGLFCAQNGFNIGSGPDGAIPMHLECNDRFEKDWDPFLASVGFVQEASNWYRKPL
jgi:SAM-dependent methyltransferase